MPLSSFQELRYILRFLASLNNIFGRYNTGADAHFPNTSKEQESRIKDKDRNEICCSATLSRERGINLTAKCRIKTRNIRSRHRMFHPKQNGAVVNHGDNELHTNTACPILFRSGVRCCRKIFTGGL